MYGISWWKSEEIFIALFLCPLQQFTEEIILPFLVYAE